jgi:predicted urease superfamily metal-dependent hydrolase
MGNESFTSIQANSTFLQQLISVLRGCAKAAADRDCRLRSHTESHNQQPARITGLELALALTKARIGQEECRREMLHRPRCSEAIH